MKVLGIRSQIIQTVEDSAGNSFFGVQIAGACKYNVQELRNLVLVHTRSVQKVRRLTQLATRYAHHILSFFSTAKRNALGPAFLQHSDTVVEKWLFLVFQPAICHAILT